MDSEPTENVSETINAIRETILAYTFTSLRLGIKISKASDVAAIPALNQVKNSIRGLEINLAPNILVFMRHASLCCIIACWTEPLPARCVKVGVVYAMAYLEKIGFLEALTSLVSVIICKLSLHYYSALIIYSLHLNLP